MGSSFHFRFFGKLQPERRSRSAKVNQRSWYCCVTLPSYKTCFYILFYDSSICERITPRLAHANAAVVLSAVKVLMKFMEMLPSDSDFVSTLTKKLAPPLVTLLSSEPEVQYVALRNINLIVQKRPDILKHEMKVFFVKYNDPIYVKLEKLDIMIRLASQANIAQVLSELKEYATEVDVDFVRKAVRAIGRCAIKVEQSAERCVSTLLDLIQTKVCEKLVRGLISS